MSTFNTLNSYQYWLFGRLSASDVLENVFLSIFSPLATCIPNCFYYVFLNFKLLLFKIIPIFLIRLDFLFSVLRIYTHTYIYIYICNISFILLFNGTGFFWSVIIGGINILCLSNMGSSSHLHTLPDLGKAFHFI